MGVSGSGKSTIGNLLADALECEFCDGDDLHPAENISKMKGGYSLNDADRLPWLHKITERFRAATDTRESIVIACSALKKSYRDVLREGDACLRIVYLAPSTDSLLKRMKNREHFMPISLLQSQLDTLEVPTKEELALLVSNEDEAPLLIHNILKWLSSCADS
jgi:gluconokinase